MTLFSVAFSGVRGAESPGLLCVLLPPSDPLRRRVPLHRQVRGLCQALQGGDAQLRGLLEPLEGTILRGSIKTIKPLLT